MERIRVGAPSPTSVLEKLRAPGMPPCQLVLSAEAASIKADFDVLPVLETFAGALAKRVRKQYDLQIVSSEADFVPGTPGAFVRVVRIDQGNRFLRYFLTLFGGKTVLEAEGHVIGPAGTKKDFLLTHKGSAGFFGGSAIGLLKVNARTLAAKIGKMMLKA